MAGGCRSIRDNLLLVLFNGLADGDVQSGVSAESVGAGAAQGCPGGEGGELVVGHGDLLGGDRAVGVDLNPVILGFELGE